MAPVLIPAKVDRIKKETRKVGIKIEGKEKAKEPLPAPCGRTPF